jgi:hypothetical protein
MYGLGQRSSESQRESEKRRNAPRLSSLPSTPRPSQPQNVVNPGSCWSPPYLPAPTALHACVPRAPPLPRRSLAPEPWPVVQARRASLSRTHGGSSEAATLSALSDITPETDAAHGPQATPPVVSLPSDRAFLYVYARTDARIQASQRAEPVIGERVLVPPQTRRRLSYRR